ncbi:MAG: lysine exporter LysO family protein [Vulcanisaeta sp.]|uniref:lysine exporter LysO family protein n=1 Tax=Vulcanisaeta sp. TaxID=2020871 RepID=UPI003D0EAF24
MTSIVSLIGDLFLVVFPITMFIGYITRNRIKHLRIGNYLQYVVMALIFTMAFWAGNIVASNYVFYIIIYSIIYALFSIVTSLVFTIPIGLIFNSRHALEIRVNNDGKTGMRLPLILLTILIIGWLLGYYVRYKSINYYINYLITLELLILILVIGLDIGSSINTSLLMQGYLGIIIAITSLLGSSISGLILHYLIKIPLTASLGISMGMGWYSLVGPLLSVKFGPAIGTLAFLTNFLREQLTYLLVPSIVVAGFRNVTLVSIGGATSMDDTLPIYRLYMGETGGFIAFVNGFVITMILPELLPYVITL